MNDSLDNLFAGDTGPVRTAPIRAHAVAFKPAEQRFEENCPKCRGTGRFVSYSGRVIGKCFACKGEARVAFKTSPETRAANRAADAARKGRNTVEALAAFEAANPAIWAWIKANTEKFDFATKMAEAVIRYGDLTTGQREAVERCIAREVAKATERAERTQQAPQADTAGIERLKAAFDKAVAYTAEKGLKLSPRITIGGTTISPAKANSANPGALYVKSGATYLGKIAGGQFFASRECSAEDQAKVLAFVADPGEAAKVYGQTTGTCCICNATLISKWKERGIGPICAQKFGW